MKKIFTVCFLAIGSLIVSSAFIVKDSSGKAGYTGSPGEPTCAQAGCHGGGTFTSPSVTITAVPSFSNDEYYPDSLYTVSVTAKATGCSRFGFACEVLDNSGADAGTLQNPGSGVKQVNLSRRNMTHTTPKFGTNAATFTFKWVAPSAGNGDAIFYTCCNAVNLNGTTTGDLPIPYSYTLTEGAPPTPTVDTGIRENTGSAMSDITVYPNPASGISTVSYHLNQTKNVGIQLIELNGKLVKEFSNKLQTTGDHSEIIDLHSVTKGIYFVKVSSGAEKLSQKMLIVN